MGRRPKPWWWKSRNGWYVILDGVKRRLGAHPEDSPAPRKGKTGWNVPKQIETLFDSIKHTPEKKLAGDSVAAILDDFLAWCYENRADSTADRYRDFCQSFVEAYGEMPVSALDSSHVTTWLEDKPWNSTTKHNAITALNRGFNWATKNRGLRFNPIKGMDKPKAQRRTTLVTTEDFEEILDQLQEDDPFRDLLVVSFDTGARPFEIKDLEARHVQLDKHRAVIPAEEAKKNIPRAFYFPTTRAMQVITRLVEQRPEGSLFLNTRGNSWNRFSVRCRFQRLQEKLGKRFKHYDFRRGWITRKIISGVDSHVVAQLSGHRSTKMIDDHYSVIADDHQYMLNAAKAGEDTEDGE